MHLISDKYLLPMCWKGEKKNVGAMWKTNPNQVTCTECLGYIKKMRGQK